MTEDGFRLFRDRLEAAREALTRAWEADPAGWEAPTHMVTVCMGLGADRPEMEAWFARAMAANPDGAVACVAKATYLLPKRHGGPDDVGRFLWKCARTRNWAAHLPTVAARVHLHEHPLSGPRFRAQPLQVRAHYGSVPVSRPLVRGWQGQLTARPDDRYYRSLLAKLETFLGRGYAAEEFDRLGEDYHPGVFDDRAEFETVRQEARALAGK